MTLSDFLAYSGALALAAAIPVPGGTALLARALGSASALVAENAARSRR